MSKLSSTCISQVEQIKGHLASSPGRGGATVENPLILYDIKSKGPPGGMGWSPNVWKTRFVLNYKQIPYKTVWVSLPDIEPTLKPLGFDPTPSVINGKEWFTLPVISDPSPEPGGEPTLVVDSQVIAEYLDSKYPQRPILPEGTKAFQAMFVGWVRTNTLPHLIPLVAPQIVPILDDPGAEYYIRTREEMFGRKLTEMGIGEERAKSLAALEKVLATLDGHISLNGGGDFLMGSTPSFADFILCASFMWMKRAPTTQDPGFETVFDVIKGWHGGRWGRLHMWSQQFTEEK
ncbi:hypothetical protein FRC04_011767 [Tulasnella sp. 424]|nr:hypothetical protein FRC04_011767 [Tulasnella sp. 424]KAG8978111.1 hypothetical protein FRC05_011227 [Tulasnella sp. 425]